MSSEPLVTIPLSEYQRLTRNVPFSITGETEAAIELRKLRSECEQLRDDLRKCKCSLDESGKFMDSLPEAYQPAYDPYRGVWVPRFRIPNPHFTQRRVTGT